jgi:hypothetical protein
MMRFCLAAPLALLLGCSATRVESSSYRSPAFQGREYRRVADAIAVLDKGVLVRRSTGSAFARAEDWTHGDPYYGAFGTFFADVNGDGAADAIVVNSDVVVARFSGAYELCAAPAP